MVQRWAARWVKNDYVQQSSVTQMLIDPQLQDLARGKQMRDSSQCTKIVHNLILVEAIKYVKLKRNFITLQQILANKKYYHRYKRIQV